MRWCREAGIVGRSRRDCEAKLMYSKADGREWDEVVCEFAGLFGLFGLVELEWLGGDGETAEADQPFCEPFGAN